MFKSSSKYKNRLFAMMPTIDESGQGISLVVLEENKKNIRGLKFIVNDCQPFKLSVTDFQSLIDKNKIMEADIIPPDVLEEMREIYLHKSEKGVC